MNTGDWVSSLVSQALPRDPQTEAGVQPNIGIVQGMRHGEENTVGLYSEQFEK